MTYGTTDAIAALVPRLANASKRFDNTTLPTGAQVDEWREQISAMLDVAMASADLPAPATNDQVVKMLDAFVNSNCATIAKALNGQGRFAQERPIGPEEMLLSMSEQVRLWVTRYASGIARITGVPTEGIGSNSGYVALVRTDDPRQSETGEY